MYITRKGMVHMPRNNRIYKTVMTALMMCMIMIMTFLPRIPVPATEGYVHLGDCMIFLAVLILGWKLGAVAAGIGSALADVIGGYGFYAPITLVVKAAMAVVVGLFIKKALESGFEGMKMRIMEWTGMILGGLVMVAGYYLAESLILYGSFITPLAAIPMNIVQFVVGGVIANILAEALYKTPAKKTFAYVIK